MGAGHFGAGIGRAGYDSTTYAAEVVRARIAAKRFDPKTRDYAFDADGYPAGVHPVDAAVQQIMHFEQGKLSSSPDVGNTLRKVRSPIGPRVGSDVQNRVRKALSHLTATGDITIVRIEHEAGGRHGLKVRLTYINERLLPRVERAFTAGD